MSYGSAGELCEQVGDPYFDGDDATKGYLYCDYKFTMPEKDANISVVLEDNQNRIYRTSDENANIRMCNRLYPDGWNPDIDETIDNEYDAKVCMGIFEDPMYFVIEPVPGYNYGTPSVTGRWTGRSYNPAYVYHDVYGWCYNLAMPAEPLDITVTATEENIYEGKEFVGTNSGFLLNVREGALINQCTEPTLKYELNKNTTYTISSTDENNFSGTGFYSFNEETDEFDYQLDDMQDNVWTDDTNAGLGGRYGQDVSVVYVANASEPMPDYNFVAIDQCAGAYPSLSQIVFKVSDDKKSLEFTGVDAIYSTVNSNHLLTDGVVLTAVE